MIDYQKIIFQIIIFVAPLGFFSCTNKDEKVADENPVTYIITGSVVDQVSKNPISGATVFFGHTWCEPSLEPHAYCSVNSDVTGRFKISVPEVAFDTRIYGCPYIYAKKEGYKGSYQFGVTKGGSETFKVELYRTAELHLHVTNDTLSNQNDKAIIRVYRFLLHPIMYPSDYNLICEGRNFDSVFILNLWANYPYTVDINTSGYPNIISSSYNKTFKPDTTTTFSISF